MDSTLVQVVKTYEKYKLGLADRVNEDTLTDFILYLNANIGMMNLDSTKQGMEAWKNFNRNTMQEIALSTLGKLSRYVDNYSRKVFPLTRLGSIEEFTYLVYLMQYGSLTKTALINYNLHQITSGIEVIKRLLKKGFISQEADITDKRSVLVKITEQGTVALYEAFEKLNMITQVASAKLSDNELIELVNLLKKLDDFHQDIFTHSKHATMPEILEQYL